MPMAINVREPRNHMEIISDVQPEIVLWEK